MLFLICILSYVLFIIFFIINKEYKNWNNGICKETGNYWIYFYTDSTGARGYYSFDELTKKTYCILIQFHWIDNFTN